MYDIPLKKIAIYNHNSLMSNFHYTEDSILLLMVSNGACSIEIKIALYVITVSCVCPLKLDIVGYGHRFLMRNDQKITISNQSSLMCKS
jgi:hypothetical protein